MKYDSPAEDSSMFRSLLFRAVPLAALACLVAGCVETNGPPREAVEAAGPARLFDPLESDKDVLAMKKPIYWHAKGRDDRGTDWEGYLVVEHDPAAHMTSGFFQWSANREGGRYHFEGKHDPATGQVTWTGFTVRDRFGDVANAVYKATLSPDGQTLRDGSWRGGISIPGTWSAERTDKAP